jgi:aubergine-like protein
MMRDIANHLQAALKEYSEMNKKLPDTIIIYRDGVGESQIVDVLQIEVE